MEDLHSLSCGPTKHLARSNGYVFNGYRFHVEDYDKKLRTQNCGVVVLGENDEDSENFDYYGVFTDTNEPFVLADQASQVFYANDNSNKGWKVVRKTQPRDAYEIVEQIDDDIVELGSPSQKKRKTTNEMKFKMKPLKIENKVSSNMKSTIIYTFVAPGAIGKGRGQGRGLKILGSIEKGREQGLEKSTMFASQGMHTIHKNSMVHEKVNVKINTSFPTSSIQVEKYTQEVESSSTRRNGSSRSIPLSTIEIVEKCCGP
ncbi:hypothetical protein KY285_001007 [Solanum tuberosum]|nr:hypothetical protein KY285_001007 [Solanum tuberosum]